MKATAATSVMCVVAALVATAVRSAGYRLQPEPTPHARFAALLLANGREKSQCDDSRQANVSNGDDSPDVVRNASEIVGRVGSFTITWNRFVEQVCRKRPADFAKAIADQQLGAPSGRLDSPPSSSGTSLDRTDAIERVRQHPPLWLSRELDYILDDQAITQLAAKKRISVSDAEVDAAVRAYRVSVHADFPPNSVPDSEQVVDQQSRDQYRRSALIWKLMDFDISTRLGHEVGRSDLIMIRHIPVSAARKNPAGVGTSTLTDAAAERLASDVAADLRTGNMSFERAAARVSDSMRSTNNDGRPAIIVRGEISAVFDAAAFNAKPGSVVGPIRDRSGYHVFEVEQYGADVSQLEWVDWLQRVRYAYAPKFRDRLERYWTRVDNRLRARIEPRSASKNNPKPARRSHATTAR